MFRKGLHSRRVGRRRDWEAFEPPPDATFASSPSSHVAGAFFSTQLLDEVGTACDLLVFPTEESEVVRFSAEVVRVSHGDGRPLGLGIRFLKMTSGAQSWLLTVVTPPPG